MQFLYMNMQHLKDEYKINSYFLSKEYLTSSSLLYKILSKRKSFNPDLQCQTYYMKQNLLWKQQLFNKENNIVHMAKHLTI